MKVLVIGGGAREHAIAEIIHQSKHKPHVIVSPGNAGIAREFETVQLDSFDDIEDFCIIEGIDFVFIGPEKALAEGLSDYLRNHRIKVIGPSQKAARIESSKVFAKELMKRYSIPTAQYTVISTLESAYNYLQNVNYPIVIKADGLASGKGVSIAYTEEIAIKTLKFLLNDKLYGDSCNQIVIEEYLKGWEVSLFVFTDSTNYKTTIFSQDHKQLYDNDQGPNTGGMGAYAPVPEAEIYKIEIEKTIIEPILRAMRDEGCPYEGILYLGLMITTEGVKVVEFNSRFGDPEAQVLLPLLETDFVDICLAILNNDVSGIDLQWLNKTAVCVYAVDKDYPNCTPISEMISFKDHIDSNVYYGSVIERERELYTNCLRSGRILAITSIGLSKNDARTRVYHDLSKVFFENMHYRSDIGLRSNKLSDIN